MNLVRALFPYNRESPLHWITFDTVSGQMIDCSMHPTHKERDKYQKKRYAIKGDKITMHCPIDVYSERNFKTITEIKIG